jgi:pimeloyl-ACP methyl ester carboxylesterase
MAATVFNRRSLLGAALAGLLSGPARAAAPAASYEVQGGQFRSFDGVPLFYRRVGKGPPVLLLHGLFGDGPRTWFATGVAQALAGAGFEAIAPDTRAHGLSAAPSDPAAYPKDVEAMDVEALMRLLGLRSIRLVGYGLGAHTAVRLMARGDVVDRGVLAGVGDRSITESERLAAAYADLIQRRRTGPDPTLGVAVQAAIRLQRLNPQALVALIRSDRSTSKAMLARIRTPLLVLDGGVNSEVAGGIGTAGRLAELLSNAREEHTAGRYLESLRDRRFGELTTAFLRSRAPAARFVSPPA